MRVLVFGGTTEGRLLAQGLAAAGVPVTVSVATPLGAEELTPTPGLAVRVGRLEAAQMETLVPDFDLCVDATHPYAVQASANIRAACGKTGVALRRALRPASRVPADSVIVSTAAEAAAFLKNTRGNVLLTTGAKELAAFACLARDRLYVRVLPTLASIAACEAQAVPHSNIVAMQGPFSRALNEALIRQCSIQWLVTKDGGDPGGFSDKVLAAQNTGARLVLVGRPREEGEDWKTILKECTQT